MAGVVPRHFAVQCALGIEIPCQTLIGDLRVPAVNQAMLICMIFRAVRTIVGLIRL